MVTDKTFSVAEATAAQGPRLVKTGFRWRSTLLVFQYVGGFVLAVVWLKSSIAHLANPYLFLTSVYRYELVGPTTGKIVAMVLPILQLFLAVCLIGQLFVGGALLVSTLLLGVFLAVQISAVSRDLNITCGCFDAVSSDPIGTTSISAVGALFFLALMCLFCELPTTRSDGQVPSEN